MLVTSNFIEENSEVCEDVQYGERENETTIK